MKKSTETARTRPILFNGEMVRAILDGRKTQTRRPMKPQPEYIREETPNSLRAYHTWKGMNAHDNQQLILDSAPLGQPGDRLWVRETWNTSENLHPPIESSYIYRADNKWSGKWKPSIHMPRWASRITLEIVAVRVERVQEISMDDAIAEGVYSSLVWRRFAIDKFHDLWNSIYNNWEDNPWVWVYEFKVVEDGK